MPILKFSGVSREAVEKYSQLIDEIGKLVNAAPENIMFISEESDILPKVENKGPIFVSVEWMARLDKEELLAKHLTDFFKNYGTKVGVFFTDVNSKWYMNGNKVG
ncbi:DUF1904 domain-containing protein [Mesoplasma syrphidae]|uniref:DUF1904 domain-containing protein n=1 Tax=Mesoplasma syrphidae TaxID=225999 RepID=A0A2K9C6I5_9MOLU|nr:DUF1904 family protein [Mesoplasma syrphidae]AUF83897.1 DUF1904 domain-containing protein [Mesoplasma syrphidae]